MTWSDKRTNEIKHELGEVLKGVDGNKTTIRRKARWEAVQRADVENAKGNG